MTLRRFLWKLQTADDEGVPQIEPSLPVERSSTLQFSAALTVYTKMTHCACGWRECRSVLSVEERVGVLWDFLLVSVETPAYR